MKTILSLLLVVAAALAANAAVTNIAPIATKVEQEVGAGFTPDKQAAVVAFALVDGTGGHLTLDHLGFWKSAPVTVAGSGTTWAISTGTTYRITSGSSGAYTFVTGTVGVSGSSVTTGTAGTTGTAFWYALETGTVGLSGSSLTSGTAATSGTAYTAFVAGTAGTVFPIGWLRPWKTFVPTSAQVICLSASGVTASPVVQLASGTTALSGTGTVLTGTGVNQFTTITLPSPGNALVTGSAWAPLSLNVVTAGTAAALNVQAVVHGFYLP